MKYALSIIVSVSASLSLGMPALARTQASAKIFDCKNNAACLVKKTTACEAAKATLSLTRQKEAHGPALVSGVAYYQLTTNSSDACTLNVRYARTSVTYPPNSRQARKKSGQSNAQLKKQARALENTLNQTRQTCSGSARVVLAFLTDVLRGNIQARCGTETPAKTTSTPALPIDVATSSATTGPGAADLVWNSPLKVGTTVIHGIFCSSDHFCIGVDHAGNVLTSTNPSDRNAAWMSAHVDDQAQLDAISCPDQNLCVATAVSFGFNGINGDILTSTNPTGGAGAWTVTHIPHTGGIGGLWCPTTALCVAADHNGDILTSTNPTGGAGAWNVTHIESNTIHGVYCPSVSFCVAGDEAGNILTTTNPTGGAGAWSIAALAPAMPILGVSCSSPTFCAAVDGPGGDVFISTNPTGGTVAWTPTHIGSFGLGGISCADTRHCVASGSNGKITISSDPMHGAWHVIRADFSPLWDVICSAPSFCAASDSVGNVVIGKTP